MNAPSTAQSLLAADELLGELSGRVSKPGPAPTMGRLAKVRYSHKAMIDLIIENPYLSQNQIAEMFGFTAGWVSNVLASEAFQAAMAARREEIIDPTLKATIRERFDALVRLSLDRLQEKLAHPQVSDQVALRCAELGAKALGVGGHAPAARVEISADRLERLAANLLVLNPGAGVTYNGTAKDVTPRKPAGNGAAAGGSEVVLHPEDFSRSEPDGGESPEGAVRADRGLDGEGAQQDGGRV